MSNFFGFKLIIIAAFIFSAFFADPTAAAEKNSGAISVYTTVAPLTWFVSAVAGSAASVRALVPPGADSHVYEPKPEQMAALASAEIYFAIGNLSPFEAARLPKIAEQNPSLRIVRLDEPPEDEAGGHDAHEGRDPHVWTSVASAPRILKKILDALVSADPENAALYNENYLSAVGKVNELDAFIRDKFDETCRGKSFLVYHPAWGRFAEEYGIRQLSVERGGREPKMSDLAGLIETAREKNITTVICAPSDPGRNVRIFAAEIGAEIVTVDPLAPDWLANMYAAAERIRAALR